jgi:hypothetical protein
MECFCRNSPCREAVFEHETFHKISSLSFFPFFLSLPSFLTLMFCLEPDEEAVVVLEAHFRGVMDGIVKDTWRHYRVQWNSEGKKIFAIASDELKSSLVLDRQPVPFFLSYHRLGQSLQDIRDKVVNSLRVYTFERITPLIEEMFGADYVGHPGSGVEELFPPRRPGRPKKRKQSAQDTEYVSQAVLKRNMRRRKTRRTVTGVAPVIEASSSDENKIIPIADIHMQARDAKSSTMFVFVEWEGLPLNESSWIPLRNLVGVTVVEDGTRIALFVHI